MNVNCISTVRNALDPHLSIEADDKTLKNAVGTGRSVRPHVRRAHWHHYWVGEGRTRLEVRWIEPTFVLPEGKREVELATVRKVQGTQPPEEHYESHSARTRN